MIHWESVGHQLEHFAEQASEQIVLVAPFIKLGALKKVLEKAGAAPLVCYTRWRAEEILAGVSDLTIWPALRSRPDTSLRLINPLHAKYFRFDGQVFVGSSNITAAALGYAPNANLELGVFLERTPQTDLFEKVLLDASVAVTDEMHAAMERAVAAAAATWSKPLAPPEPAASPTSSPDAGILPPTPSRSWAEWLPSCRTPELIFQVYLGNRADLSGEAFLAAVDDLGCLDLPSGLTSSSFSAHVGTALMSSPMVSHVAHFALTARRFGEMRAFLKQISGTDSSTNDWQTLMRWLLYFQPDRFEMNTANYSEIFRAKW
ncbi:phospholipase D family protein [Noviherbaspirillum saxi]|uniref:PLD phosphodiesterase domain-containing protein n=1 Tax=Noviherbaspirillum saxi TaxID=2320863 RepID=A0A3A3FXK7_9BURK|nr:phospholipase D family protein [Noviherbaspirillum saxi]RJF99418.1 hypothetical protein D3871_13460 [Noviherbaspirillum saxi]